MQDMKKEAHVAHTIAPTHSVALQHIAYDVFRVHW